jgi:hypothetical protein
LPLNDIGDGEFPEVLAKVKPEALGPFQEMEGRPEDFFWRPFPSIDPRWRASFRRLLVGLIIAFAVAGCSEIMMSVEKREEVYGKEPPTITESFASQEMRPGDTWKVYLKASDPGGDMDYILATVFQVGKKIYPVSLIKVRGGNNKEINGYIYLNTLVPEYEFLNFSSLNLTVQVKDKAGHFSQPVEFPLSFYPRAVQGSPSPGVFKDQTLGPVMTTLKPRSS